MKKTKLAISLAMFFALTATSKIGNAQTTSTVGTVVVPNYTAAEMAAANCNPVVMKTLTDDYVAQRTSDRKIAGDVEKQLKTQAEQAPQTQTSSTNTSGSGGASVASCFENASNQISNAKKTVNQILALLSGTPDLSALGSAVLGGLTAAACNQVNQKTGTIVNTQLNPLNQATGTIGGLVNTGINVNPTNVGGIGGVTVNPGQYITPGATTVPTSTTGFSMPTITGISNSISNGAQAVVGVFK